jgi:hypothetical protein
MRLVKKALEGSTTGAEVTVTGGARAAADGMCRTAHIAWNLDALGAAAAAGVWC